MPPTDDPGQYCFANPAVCGNEIVERGEVCDPGATVGTPQSGCAANCLSTIGGGSVSLKWDGGLIEIEGTSADGAVSSRIGNGFVDVTFSVPQELQISLRANENDLVGPFPKTVQGHVSVTYLFESWCFDNPFGNSLAPVIEVDVWEDGYHLVGSFDGTMGYQRCCSFCTDPEDTSHVITDSHFDVFLEK
jgi:hypothetical protein